MTNREIGTGGDSKWGVNGWEGKKGGELTAPRREGGQVNFVVFYTWKRPTQLKNGSGERGMKLEKKAESVFSDVGGGCTALHL